jgi:LPS export ABC transporter protein LptC
LRAAAFQTKKAFISLCGVIVLAISACTFDYEDITSEHEDQPDIVMKDVEYVRMRDGYPVVRFMAEEARRFEERQAMELGQFSFEQFETHADTVSAVGSAGLASIELDSGNIHMKGGVRIDVESEDLIISTKTLEWQDKDRLLSAGDAEQVDIQRSDGTAFTGWGFSADARRRTWEFRNGVDGIYVEKDDEDEGESEGREKPVEGQDAVNAAVADKPAVVRHQGRMAAGEKTESEETQAERGRFENLAALLLGAAK